MAHNYDIALQIEAGDKTEELIRYIFNELDDENLDVTDVTKNVDTSGNIAFEPITISAILGTSTVVAILIARLIEKWMDSQKETANLELIYQAGNSGLSDAAINAIKEVASKYADVSISNGVISIPKNIPS